MRIDRLYPMTSARLVVIDVSAGLQKAALALGRPGIGLAVVQDESGQMIGVLSKSDLVRHLSFQKEPSSVERLMTRNVVACRPEDELPEAWKTMVTNRLQNMPVLGADKKPLGVLDIRDALKVMFEQEQLQGHMLANYIAGIGY